MCVSGCAPAPTAWLDMLDVLVVLAEHRRSAEGLLSPKTVKVITRLYRRILPQVNYFWTDLDEICLLEELLFSSAFFSRSYKPRETESVVAVVLRSLGL